jgi:hypothetical protein
MKIKFLLIATGICIYAVSTFAQPAYKKSDYKDHPVWIRMMNDTSANFNETVKAFREYFKDRALPKEANEIEGQDSFEKEVGLDLQENGEKSEKEREREMKKTKPGELNYASEVRAFKGWFYGVQPWVRADGSIIGPAERQSIIDRQQRELKETEKNNGKK